MQRENVDPPTLGISGNPLNESTLRREKTRVEREEGNHVDSRNPDKKTKCQESIDFWCPMTCLLVPRVKDYENATALTAWK